MFPTAHFLSFCFKRIWNVQDLTSVIAIQNSKGPGVELCFYLFKRVTVCVCLRTADGTIKPMSLLWLFGSCVALVRHKEGLVTYITTSHPDQTQTNTNDVKWQLITHSCFLIWGPISSRLMLIKTPGNDALHTFLNIWKASSQEQQPPSKSSSSECFIVYSLLCNLRNDCMCVDPN